MESKKPNEYLNANERTDFIKDKAKKLGLNIPSSIIESENEIIKAAMDKLGSIGISHKEWTVRDQHGNETKWSDLTEEQRRSIVAAIRKQRPSFPMSEEEIRTGIISII